MSKFMATSSGPWDLGQSRFWQRLEGKQNDHLRYAVEGVVENASQIASLIVTELPTFTRHDRVHMDNVLYWMEQFITDEGLDVLGPAGCALCILAAYTHDLGMLPEAGWRERLRDEESDTAMEVRRWAAAHHADLLDLADQCKKRGHTDRVQWIETFIQRDYLRATHADSNPDARIRKHLDTLAAAGPFKNAFAPLGDPTAAMEAIADLAASHGQPVDWLARRWEARRYEFCTKGRVTNVVIPALLLRLADICDFDSSRTPPILFRQLGLDGFEALALGVPNAPGEPILPPEQARATRIAVGEWMKHLAVDGWDTIDEGHTLRFLSSGCRHPVVDRSIRHFCSQIEREMAGVRGEVARVFPEAGSAWLRLPNRVEAKVQGVGYVYVDAAFHLEAHEVTKLLMGTALYGNAELCIRELLQNALDAVQMRDLRLRLREKLVDEPDWLPPVDNWTDEERQCPIKLEWGKEADGREWISVRDAGTGMNCEQIERYFAALGRSYYKSPEFSREARLMREHGLFATPISQFGIGILSCFMMADWVEVRTCTCGRSNERQAWQVRITGPGALFHFVNLPVSPHMRPGTEVRLYLKPEFHLVDIPRSGLIEQLRHELGYTKRATYKEHERTERGQRWFNPAAVAARHVIWPRYPILARRQGESEPALIIDDQWHFTTLCPLDEKELTEEAAGWNLSEASVRGVHWRTLDWVDDEAGRESTGSRIRLVFPTTARRGGATNWPHWSLLALVQTGLSEAKRDRLLVRGLLVKELTPALLRSACQALARVGTYLWIDLSGAAAPTLTADRGQADVPASGSGEDWSTAVTDVFDRWFGKRAEALGSMRMAVALGKARRPPTNRTAGLWRIADLQDGPEADPIHSVALALTRVLVLALALDRVRDLDRDPALRLDIEVVAPGHAFELAGALDRAIDRVRDLDRERAIDLAHAIDLARDHAIERARKPDRVRAIAITRAYAIERARERARKRNLDLARDFGRAYTDSTSCHLLNEAFWPSLANSFEPLELPEAKGGLAAAMHVGPAALWWGGRPTDDAKAAGKAIEGRGMDLVFPLTVIATPVWKDRFPVWATVRGWRRLLTLPFLLGDEDLALELAEALRESSAAREAGLSPDTVLHVLFPHGGLWDKTFDRWSDEDWAWCGYSAQWNLGTGTFLWAVGAVDRGKMGEKGQSLSAFRKSEELRRFKQLFPHLFPKWRE